MPEFELDMCCCFFVFDFDFMFLLRSLGFFDDDDASCSLAWAWFWGSASDLVALSSSSSSSFSEEEGQEEEAEESLAVLFLTLLLLLGAALLLLYLSALRRGIPLQASPLGPWLLARTDRLGTGVLGLDTLPRLPRTELFKPLPVFIRAAAVGGNGCFSLPSLERPPLPSILLISGLTASRVASVRLSASICRPTYSLTASRISVLVRSNQRSCSASRCCVTRRVLFVSIVSCSRASSSRVIASSTLSLRTVDVPDLSRSAAARRLRVACCAWISSRCRMCRFVSVSLAMKAEVVWYWIGSRKVVASAVP